MALILHGFNFSRIAAYILNHGHQNFRWNKFRERFKIREIKSLEI